MTTAEPKPASSAESVEAIYRRRAEGFAAQQARYQRTSERLSNLRSIAFLATVGCLLYVWLGSTSPAIPFFAAAVCFVAFLMLLEVHRRVRVAQRRATVFRAMNEQGAARVRRDWSKIPEAESPARVFDAAVTRDLDLFGSASLYQMACHAKTSLGKSRLADWLLDPATPQTVAQRQGAVAEIAPRLDWRQELVFAGTPQRGSLPPVEPFLDWAESEGWLATRRALLWVGRLLPLVMVVFIALNFSDLFRQMLWLLIPLANIAITMFYVRHVHGIFDRVSRGEGEIERFAIMLKLISDADFKSDELRRVAAELQTEGHQALDQIRRLRRLVDMADLRFSQVYLPVQALTLWDIHVLNGLERWQRTVGRHARRWFDALADVEALASFAALAHDNSTWVYPMVHDGDPTVFAAKGLGHPLLAPEACIANDVELGPTGSFLLVTGSNMSGKSTLLRSIGTNAILALAGAPVCASALSMPSVEVQTSMRIQDSLESGVSFFLAELKRLKEIVDAARLAEQNHDRHFLYLLDEILQGTNSIERRIAVRRVMEHLLAHGAIGAISTHDLSLADATELAEAARSVHFRETISSETSQKMSFDYKLRDGLATTTNALRLLEMVGLDARERKD